jgi:hypothetical protein
MPYPPKKTDDLVAQVLSRIAQGETLASIARDLKFHPESWTKWVRADEELAIAYRQAREVGADVIADEILEIIDAAPERIMQFDDDGNPVGSRYDSAAVTWAKNRVDTRLKLLAKWQPAKYGDKQQHEHTGKDGEAIKLETSRDDVALASAIFEAVLAKPDVKKLS